jgi:hypothetical protein
VKTIVVKTIHVFLLLKFNKFVVTILMVNSIHIKCVVYPTANITFSELVTHVHLFNPIEDCSGLLKFTLMYNLREKPKYEVFKLAIFGYVDCPDLWNHSTSVVIKQCFYRSLAGTQVLYDKHSQLMKLNCLCWASALMGIVYNFIDEHKVTNSLSPLLSMVFVKSVCYDFYLRFYFTFTFSLSPLFIT